MTLKEFIEKHSKDDLTLIHLENDNHFLFYKHFSKIYGADREIKEVAKDNEGFIVTVK